MDLIIFSSVSKSNLSRYTLRRVPSIISAKRFETSLSIVYPVGLDSLVNKVWITVYLPAFSPLSSPIKIFPVLMHTMSVFFVLRLQLFHCSDVVSDMSAILGLQLTQVKNLASQQTQFHLWYIWPSLLLSSNPQLHQ